jgi:hypothetical protein
MSLAIPETIRRLQRNLYGKAKQETATQVPRQFWAGLRPLPRLQGRL